MDYNISKKAKDIIQKYVTGAFKDVSLDFYGINSAKIKELVNLELPILDVNDNSTDFIFLLENDTYLHLEIQTEYNKDDLAKFASYDLRLYLRDKKQIHTVVIYASNVKKAVNLDIGTLIFKPDMVLLKNYDGNMVYEEIKSKLIDGEKINNMDIINLIFLPLMKNKKRKKNVVIDSINLANNIKDENKRNICIGSIFAFVYKYLNEDEIKSIMEVIKITELATMLIE